MDARLDQAGQGLQLSLRPNSLALSTPPTFRLPFAFLGPMALAGISKAEDAAAQPKRMQVQIDEALGVDKLKMERRALQQEVAKWKSRAEALSAEMLRIEALEESRAKESEQHRVAQVFQDLRWRQIGLLDSQEPNRKRASRPSEFGLRSRDPQRRALEVAGRPQFLASQASNGTQSANSLTFHEEWEEYADAQEHLNGLQESFNDTFIALNRQKALVNAQHERVMATLSRKTQDVKLTPIADSQPSSDRDTSVQTPARLSETDSLQDDSQDRLPQMNPILERQSDSESDESKFDASASNLHQVHQNTSLPTSLRLSPEQDGQSGRGSSSSLETTELLQPSEMSRSFQRQLSNGGRTSSVEWPQGYLHRTRSVSTPTKAPRPAIELRSDSPRDLRESDVFNDSLNQVSPLSKHSSFGVKWQLHGSMSQDAQELVRIRSIQMEAERQKLWEAAGADPEFIKRKIKELDERASAQALTAMKLDAREALVANQEELAELALRRSIALDRREADLKTREEQLTRTTAKHHARQEEVKSLKRRIHNLERLVGMFSTQAPRKSSYPQKAPEMSRMNRSFSTDVVPLAITKLTV